ncbi:hypothetical protein E2320_007407 [Naja naja]|nr:hypothetical protein E2320_007407 [Naja naja]
MKTSYLIKFTQQTPSLSFDNAIALAGEASEILSKCCTSLEESCFQNELKPHIAHICNTACGGNERLRSCCSSKDDMGKYLCIYSLPWDKPSQDSQAASSVDEGVCREDGEVDIYRLKANALTLFPPGTLDAEDQASAVVEQRTSQRSNRYRLFPS